MAQFAILRTKKLTSYGSVGGCGNHIDRKRETPNADPTLQHLNRSLIGDRSQPLAGIVKARIGDAKVTKNAPIAFEVLLTASPEHLNVIEGAGRFEAWIQSNIEFLEREYGANLVRAELHMDETTPHIHAVVVPVIEKFDKRAGAYTGNVSDTGYREREGAIVQRVNAGHYLNGRKKLSALQDRYADAMRSFGLERGIRNSVASHKTVKSFYAAIQKEQPKPVPRPSIKPSDLPEPRLTRSKRNHGHDTAKAVIKKYAPHLDEANARTRLALQQLASAGMDRDRYLEILAENNAEYERFRRFQHLDDGLIQKAFSIAHELQEQQIEAERREREAEQTRLAEERADRWVADDAMNIPAEDRQRFSPLDDEIPEPQIPPKRSKGLSM